MLTILLVLIFIVLFHIRIGNLQNQEVKCCTCKPLFHTHRVSLGTSHSYHKGSRRCCPSPRSPPSCNLGSPRTSGRHSLIHWCKGGLFCSITRLISESWYGEVHSTCIDIQIVCFCSICCCAQDYPPRPPSPPVSSHQESSDTQSSSPSSCTACSPPPGLSTGDSIPPA